MNSFTYLLAKNQRCYQNNKAYHLMNNMKYSKIIPQLDENEYAKKFNLEVTNNIYNDGAYLFSKNGEIVAIYDYVNQTLFTDNKDLIPQG